MGSKSKLHFLSSPATFFEKEQLYLNVRKKENRIYSDEEVKKLPQCSSKHSHYKEWLLRKQSAKRLLNYLSKRNKLKILELGCGNGWLSAMLSALENSEVHSLDLNKEELEQAARVFDDSNIQFYYADIFKDFNPEFKFDVIILAASIQYFPDSNLLLKRMFELLTHNGEIHIIDTPFYSTQQLPDAKERTKNYYNALGFPQMATWYNHRCLDELNAFNCRIQKQSLTEKFVSLLKRRSTFSFPWVVITH